MRTSDPDPSRMVGSFAPILHEDRPASDEGPQWLRSGPIPALDGLRAFSVLLVMTSHSGLQNIAPGLFGVTVFFFISGFLIATLAFRELNRTGALNARAFYVRRALRLYPPLLVYLAAIVVERLAQGEGAAWTGLVGALFYFGNYLYALAPHAIAPYGAHLWSLAMEEHFYLFFPLVFAAWARRPRRWTILAALIVAPLIARAALSAAGGRGTYLLVASETRFDSLLYGVALALLAQTASGRAQIDRLLRRPRTVALALFVVLACLLIRDTTFRDTLRFSAQGLALISIVAALVFAGASHPLRRALDHRAARWIGALSYSLYLWHPLAFDVARAALGPSAAAAAIYGAGWAMAFTIAWAIHIWVERPLFAWRRRFGSDVSQAREPAPAD